MCRDHSVGQHLTIQSTIFQSEVFDEMPTGSADNRLARPCDPCAPSNAPPADRLTRVANKEPLDPRLQELVDQALASGDPMGFINDIAQQMSDAVTGPLFESNAEIELPDPPLHPSLVTVRVDIVGAQPPIWRRLELRGDLSLTGVHDQLQAAFGWLDSHLHRFDAPGAVTARGTYFITDFDAEEGHTGTNERDARLDQVLRMPGEKLRYIYDFGDDWEHVLKVESVRPAIDDDPPARCTGGRGACPPEDVGGIHTWNELAAALRTDPDPSHLLGDLDRFADWLPPDIDPDEFSTTEANKAISLVGADTDEILRRFEEARADRLPLELPEPRAEFKQLLGRCPADVIDILTDIVSRLASLDDAATEDDLRASLRPWRAILDAVGDDGVQLTAAGWLPPVAVQRVWQDSGFSSSYGKANREQNIPEVRMLREASVHAGLLRNVKRRLLLTKKGREARGADDVLLTAVAESLVSHRHDLVQDARVVSLLFIAAGWQVGPDSRWAALAAERGDPLRPWEISEAFWDDVAHLLNEIGWMTADGVPLQRADLRYDAHRAVSLLEVGNLVFELPRSPGARRIAKTALFE